jgi:hypothetical protein
VLILVDNKSPGLGGGVKRDFEFGWQEVWHWPSLAENAMGGRFRN